ncbi:MAG TPA: ureidoglycolate lyase [Nannocystis sp.]
MDLRELDVPVVPGTREAVADYGLFIGTDVPNAGLTIPFYRGAVEEGHNFPFRCRGRAVIRSARIHRRPPEVTWLERHMHMTQLFVGLGDQPFAMVLGKPTHARGLDTPDLDDVRCFIFPPGHGIMIHEGTWHDFPLAVADPVTVLTANSEEVVDALAAMQEPVEMDHGDVFKIDIRKRMGVQLRAVLP